MSKIAIIGRHGKKGKSDEKTLWKPGTSLLTEKILDLEMVSQAYIHHIDRAFCSKGFARTKETAEILSRLDGQVVEAAELSPLTIHDDASWGPVCTVNGKDLSPLEIMTEFPEYIRPVGELGANFVRKTMNEAKESSIYLFETHQPVAEPILAVLLNQWPLKVPVTALNEGDLVKLHFVGEEIHKVQYLSASRAHDVIQNEERRLRINHDYAEMMDGRDH